MPRIVSAIYCASVVGQPNAGPAIPQTPNFSGMFQFGKQVNSVGDNAIRTKFNQL
jgi:hypothetical protein